MDNDIEDLAKSCFTCNQTSALPGKAPLHPWEWPGQPWSRLHLDFIGAEQMCLILFPSMNVFKVELVKAEPLPATIFCDKPCTAKISWSFIMVLSDVVECII